MVFDNLSNASTYSSLGPAFEKAFQYLREVDPSSPVGRVDLDGDRLFAMIQEYQSAPACEKRYEAHQRYLDIQYIVSGKEIIHHAPLSRLVIETPFQADRDVAFYTGAR